MAHTKKRSWCQQTTPINMVPRSGQPCHGVGVNCRVEDRGRDRDRDDADDTAPSSNLNTENDWTSAWKIFCGRLRFCTALLTLSSSNSIPLLAPTYLLTPLKVTMGSTRFSLYQY